MNQEIFSVRRDAAELYPLLNEGTTMRYGEYWTALPREVVSNINGVDSIVFEAIRIADSNRPSLGWVWLKAIRPDTLTITCTPCLALWMYGCMKQWELDWKIGILAFLGAVFFQISVNVLNDVEDYLRLIDLPGTLRGSGVIQKGWLSAKNLRNFGYLSLAIGILLGIPAVLKNPKILLFVGALGAFGVLAYSNRPFGIKYRALGDVLIFSLVGPLLAMGMTQAAFGRFDLSILLIGLFFGFTAWGLSHASNFQDIESDHSNERVTLASWVGFKMSRSIFIFLYGSAYLSIVTGFVLRVLPVTVLMTVSVGLFSVYHLMQKVYQSSGPASALLGPIRIDAGKLHFFWGLLLSLGLWVNFFIN